MQRLLLLMLMCILLTGCTRDPLFTVAENAPAADIPAPVTYEQPKNQDRATLWFRFGEEPFLAAESRVITHSRTESHSMAILRALLAGPGAASTELRSLFPQGTQVISAIQAENVMFVTLSRHIMNGYADEPSAWRDQPAWTSEVPLRRQLAMQSIAATITENCPVDTVVILVEQGEVVTDSLRLRQSYYTLDGDMALAKPLTRTESLLLTPARTAETILHCWQERDFSRLYHYIAPTDPATGTPRPAEADCLAALAELPHLMHAVAEGGSISPDGNTAVFTLRGVWLDNGQEVPFDGLVLRLTREKNLWRVGLTQLTGREAQP